MFHDYFNACFIGLANYAGATKDDPGIPFTAIAIGGSILLLLIIAIIVSCVVHRKRLKG